MGTANDAEGPIQRPAPRVDPHEAGHGVGGTVERVTRWLAFVGGGLLLVAVVLTLVSVGGRYGFSRPLPGDYEIVELICAIGVFLFFPFTHATNSNITAEFFTSGLSDRTKCLLDLFHDVVFALVAALLTWRLSSGLVDKFANGETSILVGIPLWWAYSFAVLSMTLLAIVCLWRIVNGIGALRQ